MIRIRLDEAAIRAAAMKKLRAAAEAGAEAARDEGEVLLPGVLDVEITETLHGMRVRVTNPSSHAAEDEFGSADVSPYPVVRLSTQAAMRAIERKLE